QRLEQDREPRIAPLELRQRRVRAAVGVDSHRRYERLHLWIQLALPMAVPERLDQRRELRERVVADARNRCVAGAAGGREREAEDALLRDADAVDAPAGDGDRLAAALVDDVVAANDVGVLLA